MASDSSHYSADTALQALSDQVLQLAKTAGFDDCRISGVADAQLRPYVARYQSWVAGGYHGTMDYMARHGRLRESPQVLQPQTVRAISVRMDYLADTHDHMWDVLASDDRGYISRYATGRDYHKLMRKKLDWLAKQIAEQAGVYGYRAFVDSAPVLEKPLAEIAGLGWIGKHTNLINTQSGSWFFLGELLIDLPLPITEAPPPVGEVRQSHCGSCAKCIAVCPTGAIIAPYLLDAKRCISYLTIEYQGKIPNELRPLMGNRIYGCDDCQLVCPWNKFAQRVDDARFDQREGLSAPSLVDLLAMTEETFLRYFEGSAIRRIGYQSWQRNILIALGNAATLSDTAQRLVSERANAADEVIADAAHWALTRHANQGA